MYVLISGIVALVVSIAAAIFAANRMKNDDRLDRLVTASVAGTGVFVASFVFWPLFIPGLLLFTILHFLYPKTKP